MARDISEAVLGEMVESGVNPPLGCCRLSPDVGERMYALGLQELGSRISRTELWLQGVNQSLAASRLESLQKSYGIKIDAKTQLLARQESEGKDERYLRMLRGSIRSWRERLAQREEEVLSQKNLSKEFDEVVGGVLMVDGP